VADRPAAADRVATQDAGRGAALFGIALVEKMLSGGRPVITTETGGIGEAVGDHAIFVPAQHPDAIAAALDRVCLMYSDEREGMARRARAQAR
jgi:glycosyltransferase involved in cell wall biosynthesis